MKNFDWKKVLPHVFAIGIFLLVALFYCKPALTGKVLQQSDITQWKAMSHDIYNYKDAHGEAPLWTNSMFSGMPGYLIAGKTNNFLAYYFAEALSLFLAKPFQFFFLACVCFYFLSQVLRVNSWIGVIGALAYAYATYNPVIIVAGHDTKMMSIAILPGFIASLILIYEKKYWWGAALTAFFTGALITQNHYQITYYGVIIAVMMTIACAVNWIRNKEFKHLMLSGAITLVAGAVGALSNAVVLLPNYEYTQETIRGGSELADAKSNVGKEGLSESYAFDYSMYKSEPFVMMVPRIFGGSSGNMERNETESKAVEALQSMPQQLAQNLQGNLSFYWGGIGGTQGPPYVGAIICFLAIVGFVVLNNKHKWWILATCILAILMSWGGFFPGFNGFLLKHLPMYNKFRAPSMIIVIPTFLLCMMAVLSLQQLLFAVEFREKLQKQLRQGLIITGGVFVVLFLIYFSLDYTSEHDRSLLQQIATIPDAAQKASVEQPVRSFLNGLKEDRQHLFLADIFRSLFFIVIAAAAIWLYQRKVLKPSMVLIVIGLFSFIDVMAIDLNYLKSDNYQDKEENDAAFNPTPVDQFILKDKSWFRILDISSGNVGNAFNYGAMSAYYHKSIGGYHPAKLSIYQDLIEHQLYKYPNNQNVLDMLNTKYIIEDPNATTVAARPTNLGPVWFVKGLRFVNDAKEEMTALDNLNTRDSAVANKSFSNVLKTNFAAGAGTIQLVKNENDVVTYSSKTSAEQLAVFSEVYYDKGWNAYLDGKLTPYAKVNYVLRGMMLPAGDHTIVFKFEPKSHALGWTITNICQLLMILLLAAAFYFEVRKKKPALVNNGGFTTTPTTKVKV